MRNVVNQFKIKYILSLFIDVVFIVILSARTSIYTGHSTNRSDCLATVKGIMKYAFIAVLIGTYQTHFQDYPW